MNDSMYKRHAHSSETFKNVAPVQNIYTISSHSQSLPDSKAVKK